MSTTDRPRVYVASTLANWRRVREICDKLKHRNITITYDWSQHGEAIYRETDKVDLKGVNPDDKLRAIALDEIKGVDTAHAVLIIMPGERGSHFEMALAWRAGTPIILLTDKDSAERPTSFHLLPRVERTNDETAAIDRTIELAKAFYLTEQFRVL